MLTSQLQSLIKNNSSLIALTLPLTEREKVIERIQPVSNSLKLPIYYWNKGCKYLQSVSEGQEYKATSSKVTDILDWLNHNDREGIYLVSGLLEPNHEGVFSSQQVFSIANLAYRLRRVSNQIVIALEQYLELPQSLIPFVSVLSVDESSEQIEFYLSEVIARFELLDEATRRLLVRVVSTIPKGELELVVVRFLSTGGNAQQLAEAIVDYQKSKFKSRGIEFVSEPDVKKAAGLELLDAYLERCASLLRPEASAHNLDFTRGILLWGPPGTGKSLSAKLVAKKMGVPLISADWGGLKGSTAYESRKNINEFLNTCDVLGESGLILYFDDFDKGFAGYDADNDGGISRQMASKLLTWMQEHTSKVIVLATINNLGFLPSELIRRFEENIFFVDLPHAGARYEIFTLHLSKYFPNFHLSDREWRQLLDETNLLTPAEIGNLVKRTANEVFYQNSLQMDSLTLKTTSLSVTLEQLLEQRYLFTPSLIRDEDKIVAIRNQASFARPANYIDTSKWARPLNPLFGVAVN